MQPGEEYAASQSTTSNSEADPAAVIPPQRTGEETPSAAGPSPLPTSGIYPPPMIVPGVSSPQVGPTPQFTPAPPVGPAPQFGPVPPTGPAPQFGPVPPTGPAPQFGPVPPTGPAPQFGVAQPGLVPPVGAPAGAPPVASAPPFFAPGLPVTSATPAYGQPYGAYPGVPGQPVAGYPGGPVYPGTPTQPGIPTQPGGPVYPGPPGYPPNAFPGQPYPWQPYPQPAPPPPPRSRGRWKVALAITLIAVFVLCILPAVGGGIVYLASRSKAEPSATATSHPTQARASHEPARKPVAGDTEAVYRNWMTDRITDALAARDKALVAGDEAGYAAAVDPAKTSTESRLQHQYASLRALSVQGVQSQVDGQLVHKSGKDFDSIWEAEISIRPCFGAATCDESTTHRKEVWRLIDGQARVQDVAISTRASKGPRPWEASDLRATMGNRTIVATTSKYASSLPNLSVQAEKAAIIADRLAYRKAPAKYVIYYAGPNEWKTWFSWNPPQWAGGASLELGPVHSELVLNAAELTKSFLNNILQHELTHASTIPGATGDSADWWMVEGIAEYAEMDGSPARLYVGLPLVKQMVKNGWDGDIDVDAPRDADADTDVGAKYGIAFLAIRSLAERYGEDKMVQFFMDVVHNGKTKDAASQAAFGKSWSSISSECAQFVHSTVGA